MWFFKGKPNGYYDITDKTNETTEKNNYAQQKWMHAWLIMKMSCTWRFYCLSLWYYFVIILHSYMGLVSLMQGLCNSVQHRLHRAAGLKDHHIMFSWSPCTLVTVQVWSGHKVCTWSAHLPCPHIYQNTRHKLTAACLVLKNGSLILNIEWFLRHQPHDDVTPGDPGDPGEPPPLRGQHPALCDLRGLRDLHGVLPDLPGGGLPRGQQVRHDHGSLDNHTVLFRFGVYIPKFIRDLGGKR